MNRAIVWRWGWAVVLLCTACQSEPPEVIHFNNFERLSPENEPASPAWHSNDRAYSGQWSCRMTPDMEYGPGFAKDWVSIGSPRQLRVSVQAQLPDARVHAALIVQVAGVGHTNDIYYRMMPIQEVVKRYDTWVPLHQTFTLPAGMADDDEVKVYVWQWGEHRTIYLDDLLIEKVR